MKILLKILLKIPTKFLMNAQPITPGPGCGSFLRVVIRTAGIHLKLLARNWAARLADLLMPAAVTFVPILLAGAVAGDEAGLNFARYARTPNFAGFLLIGGGVFLVVTRAFWGFGGWLRQEMQSGTLESLYLTPASMVPILAGVALAFMIYSTLIFAGSMAVGAILFQISFQTGQLALALLFLIAGLPATYSLALLYGALVLRLRETEALLQIAQWLTILLMGVYFPITLFPLPLKIISLLFPPTWLAQGLRSALLAMPYLSNRWFIDLAILAAFGLAGPVLAYLVFARVEHGLRKSAGLGRF